MLVCVSMTTGRWYWYCGSGGGDDAGGSERATRRASRLDDAKGTGGECRKGTRREDREGTKGKRVQAGLGSDEGECVTVCIVGSLRHCGRLPSTCPALPCLCLTCKTCQPAGHGQPCVGTHSSLLPFPLLFLPFLYVHRGLAAGEEKMEEKEKEREFE